MVLGTLREFVLGLGKAAAENAERARAVQQAAKAQQAERAQAGKARRHRPVHVDVSSDSTGLQDHLQATNGGARSRAVSPPPIDEMHQARQTPAGDACLSQQQGLCGESVPANESSDLDIISDHGAARRSSQSPPPGGSSTKKEASDSPLRVYDVEEYF